MTPRRPRAAAATLALALLAAHAPPARAADIVLHETGSTLLYPLFERWIPAYAAAHPGVAMTAAATGSGAGIEQALAGRVQIGASDAYMSDDQAASHPGVLNIPLAISALTVNYNLPGLGGTLRLDGPTLAGIYDGTVRMWDAPEIAAQNAGLHLPHQPIIPLRRADASGDTFVFTQFLDFSTKRWEDEVGYGTSVAWPAVDGARAADGNAGVLHLLAATPYAVAYLGISFHDAIDKAGLGTAPLKNQDGQYLLPTAATIAAAADGLDRRTPPDERLSLVYAPGAQSYPLINYEYAVVAAHQPDAATAAAVRQFLLWAIAVDGGNAPSFLDAVRFIALPDFIRAMSERQIAAIR
ncbi:phosphate ABC transporter substrate-binding protein PstS [Acidisphaera rubrifaciens]|uniref:Phosphate-binding protein PstS n=1 Tax=Acidisphaera rubrifaciens HS-AP3 TaxID=1231350 RepID=A0A0D6P4S2_9PROT|nr:phosphate ABC transporter substrate-binding protein PstS [Acidisphaera rubrifaciens]GAN76188.1 ABC transporter phosphate permease [Acidisphaera rubrifaciens HS-AP3]